MNIKGLGTWLKDKLLAGFITASFFFVLKIYVDLPEENKGRFLDFKWVYFVLNTSYKLWEIIIALLFLYLIYVLVKLISKGKTLKNEKIPKNILNYTEDSFGVKKSVWTWKYGWDKNGKFVAYDFRAVCPKCKVTMTKYHNMNKALCNNCRLEGRTADFNTEDPYDIEIQVNRIIEGMKGK